MKTKLIILNRNDIFSFKLILPALAFTLPFFVSGPQLLIGTVINCFLIVTSTRLSNRMLFFIAVLPSLGAFSHGIVLGSYTPFLFFFLPFIWLGNIILMESFTELKRLLPFPAILLLSSLLKVSVLYFSALLYFHFGIVPKMFLISMGTIQFVTAILGGLAAYPLIKFLNENYE